MGVRGWTDDGSAEAGTGGGEGLGSGAPADPARRVAVDELVLIGVVEVPPPPTRRGTQTAAGTLPVHSSSWTFSSVALRRSLRRASSSAAAGLGGAGSPPPPPPPPPPSPPPDVDALA